MNSKLYYFYDPMCSWCWGYKVQWAQLQKALPNAIKVQTVLGGLAPDSDTIMPIAMQKTIASYWRRIEAELGVTFNYDFWRLCQPKRSTYPACRAVISARQQQQESKMNAAIQEAYYLRAMNPSEISVLIKIANEIGLDVQRFERDVAGEEVNKILSQEIKFTRESLAQGFPSLVLEHKQKQHAVPIDYKNHQAALAYIQSIYES